MRLPEEKIKEAVLHPDLDVRDAAIRYFYSSTVSDQTLMPIAIQAIERYGRTNAFSSSHYLNLLPQTEQTIAWIVAELQRDAEGPPEEWYFYSLNLSRLLCHADIRLVAPRTAEILEAPHFARNERRAFSERLEMAQWSVERCWQELHQYCDGNKLKRNIEEFDLGHGLRIVEALARQPHEYQGQIAAILAQQVYDFRSDPRKWLQPLMAKLAGSMRLQAVIPLLIANLGHPSSFLSDQSLFALAEIGTEQVVGLVCDEFPRASRDFRLYASELLHHIHLDLTVQRVLALLPRETELAIRLNLCEALLGHFSLQGIEPARQLVMQHELTPEVRELRSNLITCCKIMRVQFPDFDVWHEAARKDAQDQRAKLQEIHQLAYEADGDLGLLVQKMREKFVQGRMASAGHTPARPSRLSPNRPPRGQPWAFGVPGKATARRNDLCPCGSGKKFKRCCMRSG